MEPNRISVMIKSVWLQLIMASLFLQMCQHLHGDAARPPNSRPYLFNQSKHAPELSSDSAELVQTWNAGSRARGSHPKHQQNTTINPHCEVSCARPHTQSELPVSNFALMKIKIKKTLFFNYFCPSGSVNVIPQLCSADDFEEKVETLTTVNHNYTQHTDTQHCVSCN